MAEAKRDQNRVTSLLAEEYILGDIGTIKADTSTGEMLVLITPETVAPSGASGDAKRDNNRVTCKLAETITGTLGKWLMDTDRNAYVTFI